MSSRDCVWDGYCSMKFRVPVLLCGRATPTPQNYMNVSMKEKNGSKKNDLYATLNLLKYRI
jgi:hypothetical protein